MREMSDEGSTFLETAGRRLVALQHGATPWMNAVFKQLVWQSRHRARELD
jgi:hypothetical protein